MTAGCHFKLALREMNPRLAAVGANANVTYYLCQEFFRSTILPGEQYSGTALVPSIPRLCVCSVKRFFFFFYNSPPKPTVVKLVLYRKSKETLEYYTSSAVHTQ